MNPMTDTQRSLTPPEWMEIHRYWDKVEQILDHMRGPGGCMCGAKITDDPDWAIHLAKVLFPHRGVREGQLEDWHGKTTETP